MTNTSGVPLAFESAETVTCLVRPLFMATFAKASRTPPLPEAGKVEARRQSLTAVPDQPVNVTFEWAAARPLRFAA